MICTNTMHKVVPQIQKKIQIPVLHIAEAAAKRLIEQGIHTVGLLGTKYTMQQDFYKDKLIQNGIHVIIPCDEDMEIVNAVIYQELCLGIISEESRKRFVEIIDRLSAEGAQGMILGCTEIGLLVRQQDTKVPLFDTAAIHATEAALEAVKDERS